MDNWLINLLALILLVVVLDGARRAYRKHRDTVKVSRNLSRSMRADMSDDSDDILSPPRPAEKSATPPRAGSTVADEPELKYIDPEEAEKRRQIAAELPGSVRVVQRRKPEDATQINRQVQQNFHSSRKPLAGSKPVRSADQADSGANPANAVPEQASLNLEEQVPTLMDSVIDDTAGATSEWGEASLETSAPVVETASPVQQPEPGEEEPTQSLEVRVQEAESAVGGTVGVAPDSLESPASDRREPSLDETVSLESLQEVPPQMEKAVGEHDVPKTQGSWASADLKLPEFKLPEFRGRGQREPQEDMSESAATSAKGRNRKAPGRASPARERDVEEVLILNIMAPQGDCFEGNDLLRVLLSSGLRFGDMNIFHYHCGEAGEGPVLFSLANIVVPGTFDMSAMEDFTTPGISLFLALPAEVEALKALDTLLAVAREISAQLGGELKDENRSVFTAQTAEHYRQRVMEFQRRKALAKAQA